MGWNQLFAEERFVLVELPGKRSGNGMIYNEVDKAHSLQALQLEKLYGRKGMVLDMRTGEWIVDVNK